MAWGGGVFTRTYGSTAWQTDASNNVGIVADRHDTNDQDLADGINACINKAGGNTPTADLPMGGYKHTNLSAGTAAAPTFCAGNDQDTGMYSPAANEIGFATNGTEKVRIDANGRLGVGVTAPSVGFDLLGNIRISDVATDATNKIGRIRGRSFTNSQGDWLAIDAQGLSGDNRVQVGGGSGSLNCATSITFLTAANTTTTSGTERMRITSGGLVGIGTQSPSARLTVDAAFQIGQNATASNNFHFTAETANTLQLWNGNYGAGTERLRITNAGNVAINTTSTPARFNVGGGLPDAAGAATNPGTIQINEQSITNFTTTGGLEFKGSASGSGYGSKLLGFDNGSLVFLYRNNSATWTESARLDNSGFFSARGSKDRTTAIAANCHIDSTDGSIYRSTSSIKYKTDVADYTKGLEELKTLRPVTYKGINNGDITFAGLIAEEVHDAGFAEFVMYNFEQEPEGLAYGNMIALAVKAIKELSDKVDALTERVEALEA